MVATTLRRGEIAVIGYNVGGSDVQGTTVDSIQIVLLAPVGSGTVIFLTDRTWTPTPGSTTLNAGSFSNSGSDGTTTFTFGSDMAAGTVINIPINGGLDLETGGEALYVYQGAANVPTGFLFAIDYGDGNTTFNGSLVNTGLVNGDTAVAVNYDSAAYHGPTTGAFAHLHNADNLLQNITDNTNWNGDDTGGQVANDQFDPSAFNLAPDLSFWLAASGGGNGIVSSHVDGTIGGGALGFNTVIRYVNDAGDPVQVFAQPRDIAFDMAEGRFFIIDSNVAGGTNRIYQGNISDLIGNPDNQPALSMTLLYSSNQAPGVEAQMRDLQIDTVNNIIYFTHGQRFEKIVYNTAGQTSTVLANFGAGSGNPVGSTNNFADDFVINFATGNVYLTSHRVIAAQDGDSVTRNYLYRISGLDPADGTNAFTFGNGAITIMPFSPDDDDTLHPLDMGQEAFPQEEGTLEGLALSPDGNTLYFTAATTLWDHDGDGGFPGDGNPGTTDPQLRMGGVFSYALTGNAAGAYTQLWQQLDDGDTNSQAISETFGPQGILDDIEVDPATGQLYFLDLTGDQLGITNPPGDEGIWRLNANGSGLEFIQAIFNLDALGAGSLFMNRAPTVSSSTQATPGVTEASSALGSGSTALVQPFLSLDVTDIENAPNPTQQLHSAVVYISNNFQSGATHQDTLTINGTQSGTVNGINYNYNSATGAMTLTGIDTFNDYEATIALVRFNTSGDDITAFGAATSRTIAWSVSDGLNHSEEVTTTIAVTGINDGPVNVVPGAQTVAEEGTKTFNAANSNLISTSDVDADPANQALSVTLSVTHGTLTLSGVAGLAFTTGDGTADPTLVFTGTANAINAALNGLVYTPTLDYHGADTLTFTVNDQGFNGNDPGNSGTGTTEQDSDNIAITVTPVVDIANDTVNIAEDAGAQNLNLLANDSFENSGRAITAVGSASNGTVSINNNGTAGDLTDDFVVYTANADFNGQDSFTYTVTSGGATEQATVTVNISAVVDIAGDSPTINEDALSNFLVLANDTFEGTPAITGLGTPSHGSVSVNNNGTPGNTADDFIVYTPTGDYNGTDSFTYTVTSGGVTEQATVNVTIDAVVDIADDNVNVNEDSGANNLDLLANDSFENSGRAITAVGSATNGTVSINDNGTPGDATDDFVVYTPTGNFNGADSFTYTVTSGGLTEQATANITVAAVNDAPVNTVPGAQNGTEDTALVFSSGNGNAISVADVEAASLDVTLSVANGTLTLSGTGGLTVTGDGTDTVTLSGSATDINTALEGLTYLGDLNYEGSDTLQIDVDDNGATGSGGTLSDSDSIAITLADDGHINGNDQDNTLTGTAGTDLFYVMQTGTETLDGLGGNDAFLFGPYLDATDDVDGGPGTKDQLGIQGDYSGGLTLGANNLVNIETFVLLSGTDTRFGDSGLNLYDYDITTVDANVPAGQVLKVQANMLVAGEDVTFDGSAEQDGAFFIYAGQGQDSWTGGAGDDAFFFGHDGSSAAFTAADSVNGGGGNNDQLGLRGDYDTLITFGMNTMQNIEVLVAISSTDARFGNTGSDFDYNLKTHDANVAATKTLSVTGAMLTATETLSFDGSLELDGQFDIKGGKGDDVLIGGALADLLFGNEGQDDLTGGGGNDSFRYRSAADSAVGDEDVITDFTAGDKIDLSMMDANSTAAGNNAFTFSNDGTFHNLAGELRAYESSPGLWFVEGDLDGGGTADFAIQVSLTNALAPLTAADFNL